MTNVHTGHAVELLTVPLHKRGGFALLSSGLVIAIACLPGFIHGLTQILFLALNPELASAGALAREFGQAFVPIVLFIAGVTLISIGSNRRAVQKRAAVESVIAAFVAEMAREKHLTERMEKAPSSAEGGQFAGEYRSVAYLAASPDSSARSAAVSATAASAAA